MAYNVHNFADGDVLNASPLNQMDAQIAANETAIAARMKTDDLLEAVGGYINVLDPSKCTLGKYAGWSSNGSLNIVTDTRYWMSDYIEVDEGKTYRLSKRTAPNISNSIRFLVALDAQKRVVVSESKQAVASFTVNSGIKYIIVSLQYNQTDAAKPENCMVTNRDTVDRYYEYGEASEFVIRQRLIPDAVPTLHAYLPDKIYCAVGRTIELYNDLVCLEARKYHIDWVCSIGTDYGRKFTVTGATAGTYTLKFRVYDDSLTLLLEKTASLIITPAMTSEKNVLAIGDSLSNCKSWYSEVKTLSGNKVHYIGTRGFPSWGYLHEGRSGVTAAWYNADSSYTFDNNYHGVDTVASSANPFWNGTKFSLNHYITTQSGTIGTPDIVQILLGTNGIAIDPTANVTAIKSIVDSITAEYPTMPIMLCNTIYRSNQDGYYSTGGDGYAVGQSDFQFSADLKVMNLQNALHSAFKNYSNVTIVPLSISMDRDYNFGRVEVNVNSRNSDVKAYIPNESVHPQNAGYYQMADVMYSAYCALS